MTMTSVPDPLDGLLDPQNDTLFDFLDLFDGSPMPVQDPKDQLLSPSLPDIMHTAEQRARERSQDSNESSSFAPSAAGWPQPASPRQAAAEKPVSDKANKLKEKNRRAQQRFRERKKVIASSSARDAQSAVACSYDRGNTLLHMLPTILKRH